MKSFFSLLPVNIQRQLNYPFTQSNDVFHSILSVIGSLARDLLGRTCLYKSDAVIFSSNPFLAMSYVLNNPHLKSVYVISTPDHADSISFPYNLVDLADFRAIVEKFIFKETIVNKKEGVNTWAVNLTKEFQHRLDANQQQVYALQGEYILGGNKEFDNNNKRYLFTYLGRPKKNGSSKSPNSEQMRSKIWYYLKPKLHITPFRIAKSDDYSYSMILSDNVVLLDTKNDYTNFKDWFITSFSDLHNPKAESAKEMIYEGI